MGYFIARRKVFSERFQREVNASGSTRWSHSSKFYPNRRYCGPPAVRNVSTARAREKPGMFLQTASHRGYIKTTTLPPISRVSLAQNLQPPPPLCPKIPPFSSFASPSDLDRQIARSDGQERATSAPASLLSSTSL